MQPRTITRLWGLAVSALFLVIAVAAAQQPRIRPGREASQPPEKPAPSFQGVSNRGSFQEALDAAVARASRALPGADRMVRYRVTRISGDSGGIRGIHVLRVDIELLDPIEEAVPIPNEPPPVKRGPIGEAPQTGDFHRRLRAALRVSTAGVARGEPVDFRLSVQNISAENARIPFSSGQKYDFEVWQGARLVWRWSGDRAFTQALTSSTLRPQETVTYQATWKTEGLDGKPVPPGRYEVRGYLTPMGVGPRIGAKATVSVTAS